MVPWNPFKTYSKPLSLELRPSTLSPNPDFQPHGLPSTHMHPHLKFSPHQLLVLYKALKTLLLRLLSPPGMPFLLLFTLNLLLMFWALSQTHGLYRPSPASLPQKLTAPCSGLCHSTDRPALWLAQVSLLLIESFEKARSVSWLRKCVLAILIASICWHFLRPGVTVSSWHALTHVILTTSLAG